MSGHQPSRRDDPGAMSPHQIAELYLNDIRIQATDETVRSYGNRLKRFIAWCSEEDIERIDELDGWDLDRYKNLRQSEVKPVTVKGNMMAVKQMLDYADRIDAVEDGFGDKVPIPRLSKEEESSEIRLATDDALELLDHYRNTPTAYGTENHAALEVFWIVGCRVSGAHALDLEDYDDEERFLYFRHRPETGTPLKNKTDGERPVAIPQTVIDVLDFYIDRERWNKRDEHGREPLFTTRQGRASKGTIQSWTYLGTQPCIYRPCPHGEDPRTCQYRQRNHASKCPSSRSPHQVRTGSITWQLDRGLPLEVVAERVNAAPETIRRFYDKGTAMERLQKRRREYTADFDIHDRDPPDDEDRADRDDSATESETDDDGDDNGDDQQ